MDSKLSTRPAELAPFVMDGGMRLGSPTLRVRRLRPMLDFYVGRLGLTPKVVDEGASGLKTVDLGFSGAPQDALLTLREDPQARQAPRDFAGLYHYAVLVPDRRSLASTFLAIGGSGVPYEGFADHQVSESLYLHDVERNGMEIYADRPRNAWSDWRKISERIAATGDMSLMAPMSQPLDFESLLGELGEEGARGKPTAFPTGARIGHVHLRVTDLDRSVKFYHEKLGLETMMHVPQMGAAFLSAGGYHHHIGLNTWHSLHGTPHEDGDAGLDELKVVVPDGDVLREVARRLPGSRTEGGALVARDPDGIRISLVPQA
ncbi:MAG: VOC family protein [Thaumarchaeota archaeon]|nr:VOC family protein [Nitrososphaerota archaeon]